GSMLPGWLGPIVGAPPRCESGGHLFAPGAGAPTTEVQGPILPRWLGSIVGAPPRCEAGGHLFAPGAGAPTTKVQGPILPRWLGSIVGAPPRCELGRAFVRTRGGCSYGEGAGFGFTGVIGLNCRSTASVRTGRAPVRTGAGTGVPPV